MSSQRSAISRQLWIVLACLLLLSAKSAVQAQTQASSLFIYMIQRDTSVGYGYNYDIYVMNIDTQEIIFSSETPDNNCGGIFSPNGRWLLYADISTRDMWQFDIKLVDLMSGEITSLGAASSMVWSSDSREIAFARFTDNVQEIYILDVQYGEEQYIETLDTTVRDILIQFTDGQLTYAYESAQGTVIIGGNLSATYIVNENRLVFLTFSPDTRWLSFIQAIDYTYNQLLVLDISTGEVQSVGDPMDRMPPVWSPDGNWLAYTTWDDLYLWNAENDANHQITDTDYHEGTVVWSPDSQKIAYSEELPGGTDLPQRRVYVYDINTGEIQWLEFQVNFLIDELQWLNNTQLLYSYSNNPRNPSNDIYIFNLTTGERTNLTNSTDDEYLTCGVG